MTGDEATHSEWPVVHMVGTGEHWDSCVALPGTFLLQLALLSCGGSYIRLGHSSLPLPAGAVHRTQD